jgi:hypothetical protein
MKFTRESLEEEEHATVSDTIVDHKRWSVVHERIFEHEGKFYSARYRVPATECQEEPDPYGSDSEDMVECSEVRPVEKLVKAWERVHVPAMT